MTGCLLSSLYSVSESPMSNCILPSFDIYFLQCVCNICDALLFQNCVLSPYPQIVYFIFWKLAQDEGEWLALLSTFTQGKRPQYLG
jgi:hypothetical protein